MDVIAYDLYPNHQVDVEYVQLSELFRRSDIISLHCPLTKDTHYMINDDSIRSMRQNAIIVNTSRGGLIDTKALIRALKRKMIGGAALDVYEEETEYFFEDFSQEIISDDTLARLLTFPNVLVTSHQAFLTHEALHNIASTTIDKLNRYIKDTESINEICYRCGQDKSDCAKTKNGRCF